MKVPGHWVYRFVGEYAGLVEDMDKIVRRDPTVEVINVQQTGGKYPELEFTIYTRRRQS